MVVIVFKDIYFKRGRKYEFSVKGYKDFMVNVCGNFIMLVYFFIRILIGFVRVLILKFYWF